MKKTIVCLLGVLVACSLTLTAFAACGDDDDAIAVTGVTLPSTATVTLGKLVALTAAVAPEEATDKKVKWTVTAGTDKVKLYKDVGCKTEVGTEATDVLTMYAKGLAIGDATVKVESNADATKSATCTVTAKHGSGQACIVAVLPYSVAPYANLEVTYYDAQGNARSFTVRDGCTSDDMPYYAKEAIRNLELLVGYTIEYSKCIIHTLRFVVPIDKKITCSYKVVLNGTPVTTYPDKVFAPFAVVTGKRSNGETLPIQGFSSLGYKTLTSAEAFQTWLDTIKEKERESYIVMN